MRRLALRLVVAGLAVPLLGAAAALAAEPVDPAGTLLLGKERQPSLGKTAVSLHLAPDGSAAGGFLEASALAEAWVGTWTADAGTLTVDLLPTLGNGDPITCVLRLTTSGAVGTVTRTGAATVVTSVKLKAVHPPKKARGWTAVVPYLRDTGGTAPGDILATLLVRNLGLKGRKPLRLKVQAVGDNGLPGLPADLVLDPGEVARFEGPSLPPLPTSVDRDAIQVLVTGKKGFDPALVEVVAFEEVLRGPGEPATSGTPIPVHWARALKKGELAVRETAPLAAPRFLDDGGAGTLPRETRLVIRDLSAFTRDLPAPSVRVSVRTLAGTEVASASVPLPRGASAAVRPFDLLPSPSDLPGGEGQVRVTAEDGGDLPRGSVAAMLSATVTQSSTPVASLAFPLASPEPAGRSARLAFPYVRAPDDGSASARIDVLSLAPDARVLAVAVRALDGTPLFSTDVAVAPGASVRVDPEAAGMDLSLAAGGECQVAVGPAEGIATDLFLAAAEGRETGTPDTFFPAPAGFETAHAAGDPVRLDLLDARETLGSDAGDRDAWFLVRNGGATDAALALRAFDDAGLPLVGGFSFQLAVPPGDSLRISVEQALSLLGVPVDGTLDFRGCITLDGTAGGPLAALGIQLKRSASAKGGYALPVGIR